MQRVVYGDASLPEGVVVLVIHQVVFGDCREVLKSQPDNHFDSVVTDPPSGIGMLGLKWDGFKLEEEEMVEGRAELLAFQNFLFEVFTEVYRVLKPGAFGVVWALPRTSHHTGMALERAGFEIRDRMAHLFSQGFKKGLDIRKSLLAEGLPEEAERWTGHHTGLKPAIEDWWLIRKPISGTVIENLLKYGTGTLNIDASRVYTDWNEPDRPDSWKKSGFTSKPEADKVAAPPGQGIECHPLGRWPSNLLLSHSRYDYYRLRSGTPRGTAEAIYLYYGAHKALRLLQKDHGRDALPYTEEEVLQCEVLCRQSEIDQEEGVGRTHLSSMLEEIRSNPSMVPKRETKVLQQGVPRSSPLAQEADRTPYGSEHKSHVRSSKGEISSREVLSVEGGEVPRQGRLSTCDSECSTREHSSTDIFNDPASGLHNGTSFSDGSEVKSTLDERRDSSPLEWGKGRQPRGESVPVQSKGPQSTTSRGRERADLTTEDFEILGERIPKGWLRYFEYSRTTGCHKIGDKVLKGDQGMPVYECVPGCPVRILNEQSGVLTSGSNCIRKNPSPYWVGGAVTGKKEVTYGDSGGASRFFRTFDPDYDEPFQYVAKPSTKEKNGDLDEGLTNEHPTVKSLKLMRYLVKLVTPEGGTTLDPFAGSGTTLVAAAELGFGFLGIEDDEKTWPVLSNRVSNALGRVEEERERTEAFEAMLELESE